MKPYDSEGGCTDSRPDGTAPVSHTGTYATSLFESRISNGEISLSSLFKEGKKVSGISMLGLTDIADTIMKGGLRETDFGYGSKTSHDRRKMHSMLGSLSRNLCTSASAADILRDMKKHDRTSVSETTFRSYMKTLDDLGVTESIPAWIPRLRSKARVRTSKTFCFTDPSIPARMLGIGKYDLILDPNTFGLLFENMAVRDLRIYSRKMGGKVYRYRDSCGLTVDAVVCLQDGRWGAFEIKITDNWADEGSSNLIRLRDKIDSGMRPPSFLAVLTATGPAYTREDGIHVIPLTCLRD